MAVLVEDHVDAIRDELGHVFERSLVDAYIAPMVTTQESQKDRVAQGDPQAFEDGIADASDLSTGRC